MESVLLGSMVVVANVAGASMAMPQAARLIRTGSVAGVSAAWAGMSVMVNGWWVLYGVMAPSWAVVPVAAVSLGAYTIVVAQLLRLSEPGRVVPSMIAAAGAAASVLAGALVIGGWSLVGLTLGLVYGVQLLPAVVAAYRSSDVSGISPITWIVAWIEAFLFGVYGLITGDIALVTLLVRYIVGAIQHGGWAGFANGMAAYTTGGVLFVIAALTALAIKWPGWGQKLLAGGILLLTGFFFYLAIDPAEFYRDVPLFWGSFAAGSVAVVGLVKGILIRGDSG